jgi:hypothetical protein
MKLSIGRAECPVHVFINGPVFLFIYILSVWDRMGRGVIKFIKSKGSAALFVFVFGLCVWVQSELQRVCSVKKYQVMGPF